MKEKELFWKRLANLLSVKSIMTLMLTAAFVFLVCTNTLSQDFMTIYTVVVAFYFGTQSTKAPHDKSE